MEILDEYRDFMSQVDGLLAENTIDKNELKQCDTVAYETSSNERYEVVKAALVRSATLLSERDTNGRLVSILKMDPPLETGDWQTPYVELLQPKPTRENIDGIDCVFFVTKQPVRKFYEQHAGTDFEPKGLANEHHPYIELKGATIAIKFHGMDFGAVVELERTLNGR